MRELKTVHFDVTTRSIRIVFYDPFQHKDNIFQQVGLISLSAIGEPVGAQAAEKPKTLLEMNTPVRDYMIRKQKEMNHLEHAFSD